MRKAIAALTILAAGTIGMTTAAGASDRDQWRPCHYEDGSGQRFCVWDARHMGNGAGRSLVIFKGGTDSARYIPVTHRTAHRMLAR